VFFLTVYADILFLINFAINFPVVYLTAKMARLRPSFWRLVLGAVAGAVYAVLMFFPKLSFGYSALAKFLFSLLVVALTFNIHGVRLYIKTVGIFYLVTFCLGGGVMALFYFTGAGAKLGAVVKNGILYMNLPWKTLFLSVMICYFIIRVVWSILQNRLSRETMYRKVGVFWDRREVWLDALLDTGNALCEPFSGAPVIIAEYERLLPVLPPELADVFREGEVQIDEIVDEKIRGRIRVIPFSSLGKEHGMLIGFRPDKTKLIENEQIRDAGEVIIGIYTRPLAHDRSYSALLPPELAVR